ncbi:hypothetical protein V6N12_058240 [Hibiscus sabdariffa]|uniref:Uncharacterized protein n=1 Tax=Hibiscus sabdariffa TaxID=183260 RepID=A0ABR2ERJ4_9ROSI
MEEVWSADSVRVLVADVPLSSQQVQDGVDGCSIGRNYLSSDVHDRVLSSGVVDIELMFPVDICHGRLSAKLQPALFMHPLVLGNNNIIIAFSGCCVVKTGGDYSCEADELLAISAESRKENWIEYLWRENAKEEENKSSVKVKVTTVVYKVGR